jgi:hypothetical protein
MQWEKKIGDAHHEKLKSKNGSETRKEEESQCGQPDGQHPRTTKIRDYLYEE